MSLDALTQTSGGSGTIDPGQQLANMARNGSFEEFPASGPPTHWILSGAGATVAKDTTNFYIGVASVAVTRAGADAILSQNAAANTSEPIQFLRGRTITMGVRARKGAAMKVKIGLDDGVGQEISGHACHVDDWELITVTRTLDLNATKLDLMLRVEEVDGTAQFDAVMVVEGTSIPAFSPNPADTRDPGIGDTAPPSTPTGLAASARTLAIDLTWNANPETDIAGYDLQRADDAGFTVNVVTRRFDATRFTDQPGDLITHHYKIRAVRRSGAQSAFSTSVSAAAQPVSGGDLEAGPPATPTGLTLATGTILDADGTVKPFLNLAWNANAEGDLAYYQVDYRRQGDTPFSSQLVRKEILSARYYGVVGDVIYEARIAAIDRLGNASAFTVLSTITTAKDTSAPAAPTSVTVTPFFELNLIRFTPPAVADLALVEVWRSTTNDSATATKVGETRGISFIDQGLTASTTYFYWLKSRDTSGNISGFHAGQFAGVSGTPLSITSGDLDTVAPATPTGLTLTTGTALGPDGTVQVFLNAAWNANGEADFDRYQLDYRRQGDTAFMTVTSRNTSFRAFGVVGSVTYEVRVAAIDKFGNASAFTSLSTITTAADTSAPAAPTGVSAIGGFKVVSLAFTPPSVADFDVVEVHRSTTNDSSTATKVGEAKGPLFTDSGLAHGTTYFYWLRSRDTSANLSGFHATQFAGTSATTVKIGGADVLTTEAIITVTAQIANAIINNAHITDLSADKITAGLLDVLVRLGVNNIELDGVNSVITIKDTQGTPVTRVKIGKLGAGTTDWGIQVFDQAGVLIFESQGADPGITAAGIKANVIDATHLRTDTAVISVAAQIANAIIGNAHIADLSADKITAGLLDVLVRLGVNNIELDGVNSVITIKDTQGTPVTRVQIGKLGVGAGDWGIKIFNAAGVLMWDFSTGAETAGIKDLAVTAGKLSVSQLSAITADVGTLTAGVLRNAGDTSKFDLTNERLRIRSSDAVATRRLMVGDESPSGSYIYYDSATGKLAIGGEITARNFYRLGQARLHTHIGRGTATRMYLGHTPDFMLMHLAAATPSLVVFKTNIYESLSSYAGGLVTNRIERMYESALDLGTDAQVNTSGSTYDLLALSGLLVPIGLRCRAKMVSYTGTGAARSISGVGFAPDVVITNSSVTGSKDIYIRTKSMSGTNSRRITGGSVNTTQAITSLDADGFSLGTEDSLNANGIAYQALCIKDEFPPAAEVGLFWMLHYTGNGVDNRSIVSPTLTATPSFAVVFRSLATGETDIPFARFSSMEAGYSRNINDGSVALDELQALVAGGIEVGTSNNVNAANKPYAALCFANL